ncbi:phospholipase D-like domain-containing protein [Neisseria wadsworthii]|uniref:phospholipase D-like domain-containing protein n=1 Tax=Neisseria wadsworthii TaxID=607711 RepID=UPI001F387A97|nr:phospholipase D-like domain-containing protein [Neisseria wadsworthii]
MLKILWIIVILAVGVLLTALITYKSLPENVGRKESTRLPVNPEGNMAKHLVREVAAHKGESGLYPLAGGRDAFAARLALAENAQYSIDVQYYIWHDDVSGRLLMQSLKKAADRGVRVRMLLDDNTMAGMDGLLAALNSHPNIEVRLFNPFMQRGFRPLGFLSDFFRLNRRMHNKSFTADSVVSIVGGRISVMNILTWAAVCCLRIWMLLRWARLPRMFRKTSTAIGRIWRLILWKRLRARFRRWIWIPCLPAILLSRPI